MAHANIFQKVQKTPQKTESQQGYLDDTTLETINILGEQVISLREIIEEQHTIIQDLAKTVSNIKVQQKETEQNLNLTYIDQKDLAKQLRILKSNIQANQYVERKEQTQSTMQNSISDDHQDEKEIEELFYHNSRNSTVIKNSAANDAIKKTLTELKKLEKPKQKFLAKKESEQKATSATSNARPSNEELAKKMIFGRTSKLIR
jgi:hypothetical protein